MNVNPLNTELNPICHLLALLGAHHIFHVSGLRVKHIFCLVQQSQARIRSHATVTASKHAQSDLYI